MVQSHFGRIGDVKKNHERDRDGDRDRENENVYSTNILSEFTNTICDILSVFMLDDVYVQNWITLFVYDFKRPPVYQMTGYRV